MLKGSETTSEGATGYAGERMAGWRAGKTMERAKVSGAGEGALHTSLRRLPAPRTSVGTRSADGKRRSQPTEQAGKAAHGTVAHAGPPSATTEPSAGTA